MRKQKDRKLIVENEQADANQKRIELLTGAILLAFGVYHSILYFGHTAVPIGDFPDLFKIGRDLLSFRLPGSFKQAPVLGLLQNFLYPLAWGPSRELTAGWLLNAILHPVNLLLLWLVGKKIVGKAATYLAVIIIINPWSIYLLTEPIIETTFLFFILLTFYLIFCRSRWAYLAAATASIVRYEGAALILAAFLTDIMHNKSNPERIRALVYSALACLPLAIWLLLTAVTWQGGSTHYLNILFSKEYAKSFTEEQGKRGILLNMQVLWNTGFAPLLVPYPTAGNDAGNSLFSFSKATVLVSFLLGCIFSIIKRQWQVWMLLLFFVPYFLLHACYPYPLNRYQSTVAWIVVFICWSGLQSAWQSLCNKWPVPRILAYAFQIVIAVIAFFWFVGLVPYLSGASAFSPRSASIPYTAMAVMGLIFAGQLYTERAGCLPGGLAILAAMCLMIISNQFTLTRLLGDGKREIEFKMLGEWFASSAKPSDKMAVYNCGPAALFAGKFAKNITGFPKADNPDQLVEKLYEANVTYVVWATREGVGQRHNDYRYLGLDKNIAMLNQPRSTRPYEFIRQIGTEKGFVNVFRLKEQDKKQPPDAQN